MVVAQPKTHSRQFYFKEKAAIYHITNRLRMLLILYQCRHTKISMFKFVNTLDTIAVIVELSRFIFLPHALEESHAS